jgi:predicted  nucleic acid-binding Zn-ribbon protein
MIKQSWRSDMEETGLHPGLEIRLRTLALRIARLKEDAGTAKGLAKFEDDSEIESLEKRHKALAEQLRELDREGPGFRQNVKAEIDKLADDLTGSLDSFLKRLDSQKLFDKPHSGHGS